MTADLLIVFGLACVLIGLIRMISSFSTDEPLTGAAIMGGLGFAIMMAGSAMNPMGFDPTDIPAAVMRVVDRFG
ncbi:MAG: hypothetical protein LCH69_03535 [Proteobacteria bacterium]|nr:hypothetical protein [Pseudomonadota bacterium]